MVMLPRLAPVADVALKVTAGLLRPVCVPSTDTRTAAALPRVRCKDESLALKSSTWAKSMLPRVNAETVPALTSRREGADNSTLPVAVTGTLNTSWLALALTIVAWVAPTEAVLTWSRLLPNTVTDIVAPLMAVVIEVTDTLGNTV